MFGHKVGTRRNQYVTLLLVLLAMITVGIFFNKKLNIAIYSQRKKGEREEVVVIPFKEILRSPVTLPQDDAQVLSHIKKYYLIEPSSEEYSIPNTLQDPSRGQSKEISKILKDKTKGFFVECGALDGETRSNTLMFEKERQWEGILIEGDPKNVALIYMKHRKAYVVPACLSTLPYAKSMQFRQAFNVGKLIGDSARKGGNSVEVQCFPLYSILLAVGVTKVDYFSLDVEGSELAVLKTIPWDKVNITTLSIEFIHTTEGKDALRSYMESLGYILYSTVIYTGGLANDFIFYHPKLLGEKL